MTLRLDIGWLFAALLLSLRVAAATMLAPVLGPTQVPGPVRVIIAVGLGSFIAAALPLSPVAVTSLPQLGAAALVELIIGAGFALGFLLAQAATQLGGRTLDVQMGFGFASVVNPMSNGAGPLLGTLFSMAALAVFLALDGHHVLIQGLALSARSVPPGSVAFVPDWEAILRQSGVMFTFGLALAAPVMLVLLLVDIAMAVLARSMPTFNVFLMSFSVKIVMGLAALAMSIRLAEGVLAALYGTTYEYWEAAAGAR
jgi:flagellar biosynthesis protein FliR